MAERIKKLAIKGKQTVSNFIPFGANGRDISLKSDFVNAINKNQHWNMEAVIPEIYKNINKYMQDIPFGFKYRLNYELSNDGTPLVLDIIETTNSKETVLGEFVRNNLRTNIPGGSNRIETLGIFQNKENKISDFSEMFYNLPNLKYLTELDTTNAINMYAMFENSINLINVVDLDGYKTNRFDRMFEGCESLQTGPNINVSYVNGIIPNTVRMFENCYNLVSIPQYNLSGVRYADFMFANCYNLDNLPNIGFNQIRQGYSIFQECHNLRNTPNLKCDLLTGATNMFKNCTNLGSLNITFGNLDDGKSMFEGCSNLYSLGSIEASRIRVTANMFKYCTNLKAAPENIGKSRTITDSIGMYEGCTQLQEVPALYYKSDSTITIYLRDTYKDCPSLTNDSIGRIVGSLPNIGFTAEQNRQIQFVGLTDEQIDNIPTTEIANRARNNGWNLPYINDFIIDYTLVNGFKNTETVKEKYTKPDLSNNAAIVRNKLAEMGLNNQITNLTISNMNRYRNMTAMFENYTNLKSLSIKLNNSLTNVVSLFRGCSNLTTLNNTTLKFNNDNASLSYIFFQCSNLQSINLGEKLNVLGGALAFSGCKNLKSITDSPIGIKLNIKGNAIAMFQHCYNLDFSNIDFTNSNPGGMSSMFSGCYNLVDLNMPQAKVNEGTFDSCHNLTNLNIDWENTSSTSLVRTFYDTNLNVIPENFNTSKTNNFRKTFGKMRSSIPLEMPILNLNSANDLTDMFLFTNLTQNSYINIAKALPLYANITSEGAINNLSYLGINDVSNVLKNISRDIRLNMYNNGWQAGANNTIYTIYHDFINTENKDIISIAPQLYGDDINLDPNGTVWRSKNLMATSYPNYTMAGINRITGLALPTLTNYYSMFNSYSKYINSEILYNTLNFEPVQNFQKMFNRVGMLNNVPYMYLNNANNMYLMFSNCNSLTNTDLINIVTSIPMYENMAEGTTNDFVNYLGLTSNQIRNTNIDAIKRATNNGWLELNKYDYNLYPYMITHSANSSTTTMSFPRIFATEDFGNIINNTALEQMVSEEVKKQTVSLESEPDILYNVFQVDFRAHSYTYAKNPTDNMINFVNIFNNCQHLTDITNINITNAENMSNMFENCRNLERISFLGSSLNLTNATSMFNYCEKIKVIPEIYLGNVTDMSHMFYQCGNVQTISNSLTTNVKNILGAFSGCLRIGNLPNFNFSNVTNAQFAFAYMWGVTTLPTFDLTKAQNISYMFENSRSLKYQPLQIANVTNMDGTFLGCSNLINTYLYNTLTVKTMNSTFYNCNNLNSFITLNMSNVISFTNMFYNCNSLSQASVRNIINMVPTTAQLQGATTVNFLEYSGLPEDRLNLASRANLKQLLDKGWDFPGIDWTVLDLTNLENVELNVNYGTNRYAWAIAEDDDRNEYYYPLNGDRQNLIHSNAYMSINITNNLLKQLTNNTLYIKCLYATENNYDFVSCNYFNHITSTNQNIFKVSGKLNASITNYLTDNSSWCITTAAINSLSEGDILYFGYNKDQSQDHGYDSARILLRTVNW